jgi:hypothetical protein
MADDDRDDTTTASAPIRGMLPEDEDVKTAVSNIPAADIARYEEEAERRKAAAAATIAKAASLSRPASVAKISVAKIAVAPPPVTEAAPSTEEDDENDDSIVTMQSTSHLRAAEDPPDDSIVTIQNMAKPGSPLAVTESGPTPSIDPSTVKNLARPKDVSVRAAGDNDIYDAEDDRTERRDLPSEEIERALMRAKSDSISISEVSISIPGVHDESPTARRPSPGPYSGPIPTLPDPTLRGGAAPSDNQHTLDLDTAAELAKHAHETAKRASMRGALSSESDAAVTEKRNAHKAKSGAFAAEAADSDLATTNDAAAAVAFPPPTKGSGASAVPPIAGSRTQRIDAATTAAAQAAIAAGGVGVVSTAARQVMASDPSLEVFAMGERAKLAGGPNLASTGENADSAHQLQAVIPVMSTGQSAAISGNHAAISGNHTAALASTALAPPNVGGNVGGNVGVPNGQSVGRLSAAPMSGGMPIGPTSGNMHSASMPTSGSMPPNRLNPVTHPGGPVVSSPFGAPMPASPATMAGGTVAAPPSEPRWILLVLAVLAVCILIPATLYLVLKPDTEEPHSATPAKNKTAVESNSPRDIGKELRPRR